MVLNLADNDEEGAEDDKSVFNDLISRIGSINN